jgi:hypothetical protein
MRLQLLTDILLLNINSYSNIRARITTLPPLALNELID